MTTWEYIYTTAAVTIIKTSDGSKTETVRTKDEFLAEYGKYGLVWPKETEAV